MNDNTPEPRIPLLSMQLERDRLAIELGASFQCFGFAIVKDHGIDPALVAQAWQLSQQLFALPEDEKRRFHFPGLAGARGYTPYRTEIAKGASLRDLKEFWHIGRDLPRGHPLASSMPCNIWPDQIVAFRPTFSTLFAEFDRLGARLMSLIATYLGLDPDWFDPALEDGNSVLRLLHYPPVTGDYGDALRAGPHEDINLITLLLGAEEAGLELLGKNGEWLAVSPPQGALVVNIGDMLQRLTNHVLPSTAHRVRNPGSERAARSRYAMPFFVHLRSDFRFRTLPCCIGPGNPDRYPDPVTADEYLQERLAEIGLRN